MITENEIYWIMQMDKICDAMRACCLIFFILSLFPAMGSIICYLETAFETSRHLMRVCIFLVLMIFITILAMAFIPTTKTAATMKILPKIVNNKEIQTECSELYGIAKKALKNIEEGE